MCGQRAALRRQFYVGMGVAPGPQTWHQTLPAGPSGVTVDLTVQKILLVSIFCNQWEGEREPA